MSSHLGECSHIRKCGKGAIKMPSDLPWFLHFKKVGSELSFLFGTYLQHFFCEIVPLTTHDPIIVLFGGHKESATSHNTVRKCEPLIRKPNRSALSTGADDVSGEMRISRPWRSAIRFDVRF